MTMALTGAGAMGGAIGARLVDTGTDRAATENLLARFFTGRIHHHVTTAHV